MSLVETIAPPPLPPPPLRTIASTMAITTTRTTPPAIASARGDAWRARPPAPFERTGGGAAARGRLPLLRLALLPLGMRGKGSRYLGLRPVDARTKNPMRSRKAVSASVGIVR